MPEYIIYELSLLALAAVAARRVLGPEPGLAEHLCLTFCLKLLASSVLPFLATALRINGPVAYWAITLLSLIGAVVLGRRLGPLRFNLPNRTGWAETAAAGVVILFSTLIGVGRTGPLAETDSLVNFSYIIEWAHNAASPYFMAYDYSSLWEMNFVPAVVFHGSDAVLWWPAAESIFLFGLALYLLAAKIVADRRLTWLIVAATITLPGFFVVSGYGTLKNDMIYNAGALLLVFGLASRNDGRAAARAILTLSGIVFLSVKFSGPPYAACLVLAWLAIAWRSDRASIGQELRFVVLVGLGALILGGHYYVKNIVLFHNPLYPYPVKLGPVELPGVFNLPTTSLLRRWKEPALWADFLHSPVYGLAAPICVLAGLAMGLLLTVRPGRSTPGVRSAEILVVGACAVGWLVYVGSIFSDVLGPLLLSVRYATAAIALCFILLARGARSLGPLAMLAAGALLAWCALSQGLMMFTVAYRYDLHSTLSALARHAAVIALLMAAIAFVTTNFRPVAIVVAAAACLILGSRMAEINRARGWLPDWSAITDRVTRFRSGESIYLVTGFPQLLPLPATQASRYLGLSQVLYPAIGIKFKNRLDVGDIEDLAARLRKGQRYDGVGVEAWAQLDPAIVQDITSAVSPYGYVMTGQSSLAAFYTRPVPAH